MRKIASSTSAAAAAKLVSGEQRAGLPRRVVQCRGKGFLQARQPPVDLPHASQRRLKVGDGRLRRCDRRVQGLRRRIQFGHAYVRLGPDGHRRRHETNAPEPPEQANDAFDIVRIVVGVAKSLACDVEVGIRLVEFDARGPRSGHCRHIREVTAVRVRIPRLCVLLEFNYG